jgi:hypothetical protein
VVTSTWGIPNAEMIVYCFCTASKEGIMPRRAAGGRKERDGSRARRTVLRTTSLTSEDAVLLEKSSYSTWGSHTEERARAARHRMRREFWKREK